MIDRPGVQLAGWALAAAIVVVAAFRLLGPGSGAPAPAVRIDDGAARTGRAPVKRGIYVHVAGAVRSPGLYRLRAGERAAVAVRRAGGFGRGADSTAVNLAARLHDGQQVVVPKLGAAATAGRPGAPGGPKVNLSVATPEQLDSLDGIGPTLAQRIVEFREAHGGFRSLEQLREVDGIGEQRFSALRKALGP